MSSGGNRFDPQSYDYGVLYFGTTLQACFAETLTRFRPTIKLLALVEDEWRRAGFMAGDTSLQAARRSSDQGVSK
jgi:hypothetical protein